MRGRADAAVGRVRKRCSRRCGTPMGSAKRGAPMPRVARALASTPPSRPPPAWSATCGIAAFPAGWTCGTTPVYGDTVVLAGRFGRW